MDSPKDDGGHQSFYFKPQVNEESKDPDTFNKTMTHEETLKLVNFPFDLNKLFNMSYSFDVLK